MTMNIRRWLVVAAILAAVGSLLAVTPTSVVAQIRAALVRDVDNPARQPFSAWTSVVEFDAGSTLLSRPLLTVPAGKRAVVEHMSCVNYLEVGNNFVRFEMRYTTNGTELKHQFVNTRAGTSFVSSADIWSFSQPVRAYADAGTEITVYALRRLTAGLAGMECYASGHYVDMTP